MHVYPFIDQEWVIENMDHVMKEFLTIHPEFRAPDNASMSAKSRHKKNMMKREYINLSRRKKRFFMILIMPSLGF